MKKKLLKIVQAVMLFVLIATSDNRIGVSVVALIYGAAAYAEGLFYGEGDNSK